MAGRPRKMAQRVSQLEERLFELAEDLRRITPQQYVDGSSGGPDPSGLSDAWLGAVETVDEAALAVEHLADILRGRAGIVKCKPDSGTETAAQSEPVSGDSGDDTDETVVAF